MLSYAWAWKRDVGRLRQAAERMNECPLGSGALAGHPFGIDRHKFGCGNPEKGTLFPDSCDAGEKGKISVNDIYEEYHLDRFTTYQAIVALFVMFVVARSVAYLLLRRRMKQKERELMKYQDATVGAAEEESKEDVAVAAGAKV